MPSTQPSQTLGNTRYNAIVGQNPDLERMDKEYLLPSGAPAGQGCATVPVRYHVV